MEFDPENNVTKLCAQGMEMEGEGGYGNMIRAGIQKGIERTGTAHKNV